MTRDDGLWEVAEGGGQDPLLRAHTARNSLDFYDGSRVVFRVGAELAESLGRGCATRGRVGWSSIEYLGFPLLIRDRPPFLAAVPRAPCYASCLQAFASRPDSVSKSFN